MVRRVARDDYTVVSRAVPRHAGGCPPPKRRAKPGALLARIASNRGHHMSVLIGLAVAFGVSWVGYSAARRLVRERLRYVAAALSPGAAILAGLIAAIIAYPVAWLLPFIGPATALGFGVGTGLGARAGAADVKRGYRVSDGG